MKLNEEIIQDCCKNQVKAYWLQTPTHFPDFLPLIPSSQRLDNEVKLEQVSSTFQKHLKSFPLLPGARSKWKQELLDLMDQFLKQETILGIQQAMSPEIYENFNREIQEFLRQTRAFAPELTFDEIGQGIRNYIVYLMINQMHDIHAPFNMACFGYSLLYPFTDNYVDNPQLSNAEKDSYNHMIGAKISGQSVCPQTLHQIKTCQLLDFIENKYSHDPETDIFTLLLLMLQAQKDSLQQQNHAQDLSFQQRLDISIYKGGLSVLIDRFFVDKEIQPQDLLFYLQFGFFLQLADDLQDIEEDATHQDQSLFTLSLESTHIESLTNQMFHFLHQLMTLYKTENNEFKNFVLTNSYQLIYSSAIRSKKFFSPEYLKKLECHFTLSIKGFESVRSPLPQHKDTKIKDNYLKIIDEMISQ